MPQSNERLRKKFSSDSDAMEVLKGKFSMKHFYLYPTDPDYKPNQDEDDAIDYLCCEWDYGYSPKEPDWGSPNPGKKIQ